ncbi:winged helix DNA-binding domain-containing protein [Streptomyces sp. NPDC004111]|uniref:winged helix DNA-binding domain-containing protein n=1 Tax=Streptomyces sp. NPDC004111 TaxID=3364690 RepID=UPI0036B45FEE
MTTSDRSRPAPAAPILSPRALNRATLARQLLLTRTAMPAKDAVRHLVGLQAQNTRPPYLALAARLDGFDPQELSGLMESREVARIVTMRSTLHTLTADDCLALRPLVQPVIDRELRIFLKRSPGVDIAELAPLARELVEERPRSLKELREGLLKRWPDNDPQALATLARCALPLLQTTPRGLWGRSGQVTLTTSRAWFGRPEPEYSPAQTDALLDATVLRYLGAFGPASVRDMQSWCGLTRLRPAFERLRPRLLAFRDVQGTELFDLPDAPRPDEDTPAPVRLLPEFDNLLLSHADRSRVVPPEHASRTWYVNTSYSTVLVDGLLAGIWRAQEPKKDGRATLTVELFADAGRARRTEIAEEAVRTLELLSPGADHDVRFGEFYGTKAG